jgi:hypothetical protein
MLIFKSVLIVQGREQGNSLHMVTPYAGCGGLRNEMVVMLTTKIPIRAEPASPYDVVMQVQSALTACHSTFAGLP